MSQNIFTIFCHGTDFHRDKNPNELITQLSVAMDGNEARIVQTGERNQENPYPFELQSENPNYLICEGPGSQEVSAQDSKSGVHHARPGKFNPIFDTKKGRGQAQNPGIELKGKTIFRKKKADDFQAGFTGNTPKASKVWGEGLGRGWDDNVYKATWMLTHLKFEIGQPIDTVNIVGWSRGAVTCLKIANKLFEVFEDTLNVNIFAVDPVPGGYTTRTSDMLAIPPNVRNYLAVLALDADGSNFQPTDRHEIKLLPPQSQLGKGGNSGSLNPDRIKPHVHFLPLPGNHSDLVNANCSHPLVENSAILCRHLGWQFLTAHGTPLAGEYGLYTQDGTPETPTPFLLSSDEVQERYDRMLPHLDEIAKAASTGKWNHLIDGRHKEREVRKHREEYVCEPQKYINEHHRLCTLKQDYPSVPESDDRFLAEEWIQWSQAQWSESRWFEAHTFPLPKQQTHLQRMGITAS